MLRLITLCAVFILVLSSPAAAEKVALRAANGRFLHVADDGAIRAEAVFPSDKETFELVSRGPHEIALQGPGGRFLVPDSHDGRALRLAAAGVQPAGRETFQLVPAEAGRFVLRLHGSSVSMIIAPAPGHAAEGKIATGPGPRETVEIYRVGQLPGLLQTALPEVVRGLAAEELMGKQYDKTQTHDTQKYIDLPAPTLKDPKRMKRRQVIGITEEYRIQAQLDGQPDIRIPGMLFLSNYADGGPGLILLAVNANLPIRGRVEGKVPDVISVSTGYQITVQLSAVAEVVARHAGNSMTFDPPAVIDLHVSVSRAKFSNDLLEAARREIRRVINRELNRNEQRIRESANRALQKALAAHEVRIPLLGFLRLL